MERNRRVGRGEIDLIAADGRERVAVEVKARTGDADPTDGFTVVKERQVRMLAAQLGISRVDLIAISIGDDLVEVRWVPEF